MSDDAGQVFWYPGHELLLRDIVRAENCHLWDAAGKRYVDLESGVWCTSIGHSHPRIRRVIGEQSARIAHAGFAYSSAVVQDAAREILALLGFKGGRCVFLCSGSEAVEYGVRVAQSLIGRSRLMTMTDSYFGAYGSASRKQSDEWFLFDWLTCAGSHGDGFDGRCEHLAAVPFAKIGGFLFEPGSSSGLVRFPPEPLIRTIVAEIRKNGGLVLVNEVTTGIGRTGTWFGFQHYGLAPDIVALGKGIGNGYPVSVAAFAPGVVERLGGRTPHYSQSHQNDPLGAAVAREVVRIIEEEGLVERGVEVAARLATGLGGVASRMDRIREVRCGGLMAAIELRDDPGTPFTIRVHRELITRGYVVGRRPGVPVLRLDPSLTVDIEDIDGFLEGLEAVLVDPAGGSEQVDGR